jgi:hypothetical protein
VNGAEVLILRALRQPARLDQFSLPEWDLLLRQSVSANLTATLLALAEEQGLLGRLPPQVREQFAWVRALAERHVQAVRFEVMQISVALGGLGIPLILLKGAAYTLAGLPAARGRLFSDIDILVPKARMGEVEAALMMKGWECAKVDAYDQRYYRQWMHEIPPMRHIKRQSVIDVHHAILPETAALRPDPDKLRAGARPVAGEPGVHTLAPADMVLHSAVHLFHGEFEHGLRDLFDIHRLLQHYRDLPGFWPALAARARELELTRPLFYALRYAAELLGTVVPPALRAGVKGERPNRLLLRLMDGLFRRALLPSHPSCTSRLAGVARVLLYVRANWLRMPPLLLARHLLYKAFIAPRRDRS